MATERQKRVVSKITENIRNKEYNSKGELLRDCDYSESMSEQPNRVLNGKGIQEGLEPLVKQLEAERQRAIKELEGKIDKASYSDLTRAVDILTKNIQLLTGGETERTNQPILVKFIDEKPKDNRNTD